MPKIFRKLRSESLRKNEIKKYTKYAFGEIFLVVIGILIALSINTCNENKTNSDQEKILLSQIQKDIFSNQNEIISLSETLEDNIEIIDTLMHQINNEDYDISLAMRIGLIHRKSFFNSSSSGYNLIRSGYAPILKNTELLNSILELYEVHFDDVKTYQEIMHQHIENRLYPQTNKLFKVMTNYKLSVSTGDEKHVDFYEPLDFMELKNNHDYINTLHQLKTNYNNRYTHCETVQLSLDSLLINLEKELNQ